LFLRFLFLDLPRHDRPGPRVGRGFSNFSPPHASFLSPRRISYLLSYTLFFSVIFDLLLFPIPRPWLLSLPRAVAISSFLKFCVVVRQAATLRLVAGSCFSTQWHPPAIFHFATSVGCSMSVLCLRALPARGPGPPERSLPFFNCSPTPVPFFFFSVALSACLGFFAFSCLVETTPPPVHLRPSLRRPPPLGTLGVRPRCLCRLLPLVFFFQSAPVLRLSPLPARLPSFPPSGLRSSAFCNFVSVPSSLMFRLFCPRRLESAGRPFISLSDDFVPLPDHWPSLYSHTH